jgi:protein-S-isoprenylcysteine O-methyltransferase Ste14
LLALRAGGDTRRLAVELYGPVYVVFTCGEAEQLKNSRGGLRGVGEPMYEESMKESRDAAAVRVFPPAVPLLTILLGLGLDRLWPLALGFDFPRPANYWIGGALVAGAILGLGWRSVTALRRTGQSENPWKPTTEIVTRGPFRFTRNPMYLQMLVGCIGFAIILTNIWIVLLTPVCAWVLQRYAILPEEAYLERKFGENYLSYKRRVRRWL